jgi:hypothetical protein
MPKTTSQQLIYDVDSRWNSAYDIIVQYLDLFNKYTVYVDGIPQIKCLLPGDRKTVALRQLAFVLKLFKDITLKVLEDQPSLAYSLEIY